MQTLHSPTVRQWPGLNECRSGAYAHIAPCDALVIDAGNTLIKAGWFTGQQILEVWQVPTTEFGQLELPFSPQRAVLSSVGFPENEIKEWLNRQGVAEVRVIRPEDPMPFKTLYKTPETLGSDRKMLVNGANILFPGIPRLVVCMGTCITYDWISSEQIHQGGFISPGLRMRWESMHKQTGRLPLVTPPDLQLSDTLPATDTQSALQWGVVWAVRHEIRGFWNEFKQRKGEFSKSQLIIAGGDAHFFEIRAEEKIFAAPYLALTGLRAML